MKNKSVYKQKAHKIRPKEEKKKKSWQTQPIYGNTMDHGIIAINGEFDGKKKKDI